jgi:hypothetical protein
VPLVAWVIAVIEIAGPSGSLSLASTSMSFGVLTVTLALSSVATGGALRVMVTVPESEVLRPS